MEALLGMAAAAQRSRGRQTQAATACSSKRVERWGKSYTGVGQLPVGPGRFMGFGMWHLDSRTPVPQNYRFYIHK